MFKSIMNTVKAAANKTAYGAGYGIGYGTTTVVEEAKYATKGIKEKLSKTAVADGYRTGKADALTAFDMRVAERIWKEEQEQDEEFEDIEEVDEAVQEFMDNIMNGDWDMQDVNMVNNMM